MLRYYRDVWCTHARGAPKSLCHDPAAFATESISLFMIIEVCLSQETKAGWGNLIAIGHFCPILYYRFLNDFVSFCNYADGFVASQVGKTSLAVRFQNSKFVEDWDIEDSYKCDSCYLYILSSSGNSVFT
jgi:hypothetical protein